MCCLFAIAIPLALPIVEEIKTCVQMLVTYTATNNSLNALRWTVREFLWKSLYYYPYNYCAWQLVRWLCNSIILSHRQGIVKVIILIGNRLNIALLHIRNKLFISWRIVIIWLEASHTTHMMNDEHMMNVILYFTQNRDN